MALDRDGAVSGSTRRSSARRLFFAYPGGVLMSKALGELDEAELAAQGGRAGRGLAPARSERSSADRAAVEMLEEASLENGWVEPALRAEFRGLGLRYTIVAARTGRSPRELKHRLRHLSDRVHGERVVNLRREPVASAYRVFFRQIGIDPDEHKPPGRGGDARAPSRRAVREPRPPRGRAHGRASSRPAWRCRAFDADRLDGALGLRIAQQGEHLAGDRLDLPEGAIVVADERRPVGLVFGDTGTAAVVARETRRIALCVVRVPGIPDISVEEALWTAAGILTSGQRQDKDAEMPGNRRVRLACD